MPKLKKGEQLFTLATGLFTYTSESAVDADALKELGLAEVGRISTDSNIRIGETPLGEILRSYYDWKDSVKGIEKPALDAVSMHIAFQMNEEDREKVMRDWFSADAAGRAQLVTDMAEAISQS